MLRSAALLTLLPLAPRLLGSQQVSPDRLPLAEQFQMHYFIHDSIVAALPGYVGFDSDFPCSVVVHLLDTLAWADSARALFRHALAADTSAVSREYCSGRPEVRVHAARYSVTALMAFARRIDTVLAEPALRVRGSVRVTPETLIVGAHNRAALERARNRLARETTIPQDMLAYKPWIPEEVDGPVAPPRAAYLAVLDTIAVAPAEAGRPFVIDLSSLPATVNEGDLHQRGLRQPSPADTCGTTLVSFNQPRQFVSGAYAFSVSWRAYDYYYEVRCESGGCRVTRAIQLPGDKITTSCSSAEFGPAGLTTFSKARGRAAGPPLACAPPESAAILVARFRDDALTRDSVTLEHWPEGISLPEPADIVAETDPAVCDRVLRAYFASVGHVGPYRDAKVIVVRLGHSFAVQDPTNRAGEWQVLIFLTPDLDVAEGWLQ